MRCAAVQTVYTCQSLTSANCNTKVSYDVLSVTTATTCTGAQFVVLTTSEWSSAASAASVQTAINNLTTVNDQQNVRLNSLDNTVSASGSLQSAINTAASVNTTQQNQINNLQTTVLANGANGASNSPFALSLSEGSIVGASILAVWATAWGIKMLVRSLGSGEPER